MMQKNLAGNGERRSRDQVGSPGCYTKGTIPVPCRKELGGGCLRLQGDSEKELSGDKVGSHIWSSIAGKAALALNQES